MKKNIQAKDIEKVVSALCSARRQSDALNVIKGFLDKGYVNFSAANKLLVSAKNAGNHALMNELSRHLVDKVPADWRTWRLAYTVAHVESQWGGVLRSLDKIAQLSKEITPNINLARAEALERLLKPEDALVELDKIEEISDPAVLAQFKLVKSSAFLQMKRNKEVESELVSWLASAEETEFSGLAYKVLGKAYDGLGKYQEASVAFGKGNEIRARYQRKEISENRIRRLVEVNKKVYTEKWVGEWHVVSEDVPPPVFLLGFPRSGTTLLEQMLDAHPAIQALDEPATVHVTQYQSMAWLRSYAMANNLIKRPFLNWKDELVSTISLLKEMSEDEVRKLRETYYEVANKQVDVRSEKILVDKMPLNTVDIGFILRVFPNAKFVVALRHPCDCVLSCFMQSFSKNDGMANFLELDNAASFYKHVMRLLWQYERVFDLRGRLYFIKYEDVIADFESEARGLLDFLEVEWSEAVLDYDAHAKSRGTLSTPSYYGVTQKIYNSSRERWRCYGELMKPVLHHFREAGKRYDYDLSI